MTLLLLCSLSLFWSIKLVDESKVSTEELRERGISSVIGGYRSVKPAFQNNDDALPDPSVDFKNIYSADVCVPPQ